MIAKLVGLALDARTATRGVLPGEGCPAARAVAARWIAANALAVRGVRVALEGTPPVTPSVLGVRADSFAGLIAAIASVPVLVDAAQLPRGWNLALRALGLPALDRSTSDALAGGASVLGADGFGRCELAVELDSRGYLVRIAPPERMLVA